MLTLITSDGEYYNEETSEFISVKGRTLKLEHSLVSLSKWESTWCKPFLTKTEKTNKELMDYIRCMIIDRNVPEEIQYSFSKNQLKQINDYIDSKQTATTFSKLHKQKPSNELVTAELIYYWMISLNIPFECEKWHLNRLLTLIRVCTIKSTPTKKMPKSALMRRNTALNAARRQALNTKG